MAGRMLEDEPEEEDHSAGAGFCMCMTKSFTQKNTLVKAVSP
jgi:hypothetical protein